METRVLQVAGISRKSAVFDIPELPAGDHLLQVNEWSRTVSVESPLPVPSPFSPWMVGLIIAAGLIASAAIIFYLRRSPG